MDSLNPESSQMSGRPAGAMSKPEGKSQRGFWLTAWLVLILIGAVLGFIGNLAAPSSTEVMMIIPAWASYVLAIFSAANIVFIVMLFKWKLMGFYGMLVVAALAVIINIVSGLGVGSSLLGLLGPLATYLFMRPTWKMFK
ncbi:MAG: hypothetical protein Q8P30_01795 [Candidatus Uhrbacteria bacterium]|nr:hypothetical protein [Candidatus Uhrbacteria bacterium]